MSHFVLIGASGHLGSSLIESLILGGHVLSIGSRDVSKLESMAFSKEWGASIQVHYLDVMEVNSIDNLLERAVDKFGFIDGLVFLAGRLGEANLIHEIPLNCWNDIIDTNLTGAFRTLKAVLPIFIRQGCGKLVLVSGGGASGPLPTLSPYAVSKVGLVKLVECAALEYPNLQIVAVAPGIMPSKMVLEMLQDNRNKLDGEYHSRMTQEINAGRDSTKNAVGLISKLLRLSIPAVSGKLISAEWDPWYEWSETNGPEVDADLYTLRRVTE